MFLVIVLCFSAQRKIDRLCDFHASHPRMAEALIGIVRGPWGVRDGWERRRNSSNAAKKLLHLLNREARPSHTRHPLTLWEILYTKTGDLNKLFN